MENKRSAFIIEHAQREFEIAQILKHVLNKTKAPLAFDIDGPILKGDVITSQDMVTDPAFARILPLLDHQYGLQFITARNTGILGILQELSGDPTLGKKGKHAFEGAHVFYEDNELQAHPDIPPSYQMLSYEIYHRFRSLPHFRESWEKVLSDQGAFCMGDLRWQGKYTQSWWFRYEDRKQMSQFLIETAAPLVNGSPPIFSPGEQEKNNLAWLRIRHPHITKASALDRLHPPAAFIYDGPGDLNYIRRSKRDFLPGLMIAILNTPDEMTPEICQAHQEADIQVADQASLARILAALL